MAAGNLAQVQAQLDALHNQLRADGLLDEQFTQLLQLQDETNPDFVTEVVQLYFEDSGSKLDKLAVKLSGNGGGATGGAGGIDYNDVDQLVHQFKGSSASFGAQSIAAACVRLREACLAHDPGACQALLQHIQQQFQVGLVAGHGGQHLHVVHWQRVPVSPVKYHVCTRYGHTSIEYASHVLGRRC